jgi:hypothetical protein
MAFGIDPKQPHLAPPMHSMLCIHGHLSYGFTLLLTFLDDLDGPGEGDSVPAFNRLVGGTGLKGTGAGRGGRVFIGS